MPSDCLHERVKMLYRMLFEMAMGNLTFRLNAGEYEDDLDDLGRLLNNIASRMQVNELQEGNYETESHRISQLTLVLEKNLIVRSITSIVPIILSREPETIFGSRFRDLLSKPSRSTWEKLVPQLAEDPNFHERHRLAFSTGAGLNLPTLCTISRLIYSDKVVVSAVAHYSPPSGDVAAVPPKYADAAMYQKLYDYILENLEDPLPTTRELSKLFGTNEFRLKDGFRYFFKTSIYHFYHEERLKKAHGLIVDTNMPIKEIAFLSGFNDYTNFYKAFRKRFGYAPTSLIRPFK